MKMLSIFLALILQPIFCHSESKPDPLNALVAKVLDDGEVEIIKPAMAAKLGLGSDQVIARSIGISHTKAPDGQDHGFLVVVHSKPNGEPVPQAIEIRAIAAMKKDGDQLLVDGYIFKADLSGHLEMAFHNSGPKGHLQSEEMPVDKRKTKKLFQKEMDLFLAEIK